MAVAQEHEWVVQQSDGCWFSSRLPRLHAEVSLGKILRPKLLLMYMKLFIVLEEKENSQPMFLTLVGKRGQVCFGVLPEDTRQGQVLVKIKTGHRCQRFLCL